MIEDPRRKLTGALQERSPEMQVEPDGNDREQPIRVRLLGYLLRACDDPDWKTMSGYAHGIRYGISERLPRTPAVYPQKKKWRLEPVNRDQETLDDWRSSYEGVTNDNYRSATIYPDELDKILKQKVTDGRAFKLTLREARQRYGKAYANCRHYWHGPKTDTTADACC